MKKGILIVFSIFILMVMVACDSVLTSNLNTTAESTQLTTDINETSDVSTTEESTAMTTEVPTTTEEVTNVPTTEETTTMANPTETGNEQLGNTYYQYSTSSTQNIIIYSLNVTDDVMVFDSGMNQITTSDVLVKNGDYYEIKSSYILGHEGYDYVEFNMVFDQKITLVQVALNDKTDPYIISSTSVSTDGSIDLVFQFELFNGIINQVSSTHMTESDYLIEDNILTVYSGFISDELANESSFMVSYALYMDGYVIGFISIDLE